VPSGSFQVTVYAGDDPLTGKKIDLSETVPAGPNAAKQAEKVRVRLLNRLGEQRHPSTAATVDICRRPCASAVMITGVPVTVDAPDSTRSCHWGTRTLRRSMPAAADCTF
jgi:hypothetical protein